MNQGIHSPDRKYVTASEKIKLIGSVDGTFPDFGHHQEDEMGGLWMHPIKLLDGFWLRFKDCSADNVHTWTQADHFENYPHKTEFTYGNGLGHTQLTIKRTQLAPDSATGLLVRYDFISHSTQPSIIETEFVARTDMRPVWLSEKNGIEGGKDAAFWDQHGNVFACTTVGQPWCTAVGCSVAPTKVDSGDFVGGELTKGEGVSLRFLHQFTVTPNGTFTIEFYISGSMESMEDCMTQLEVLRSGKDFETPKENHYKAITAQSTIVVNNKNFETIFDWIKVNNDWLIIDAGAYGRGITAGLPEYPFWFGCDNCYALQGVLALGNFQLARDTLALVLNYSEKYNGNGRIIHEITTFGVLSNPGNTQETAHFLVILWKYFQWTGDRSLLALAFPYITKSVQWLQEQDGDGSLFPMGYGIMEVQGLNSALIDTAVYTCEAYACYAQICTLLGHNGSTQYWDLHHKLKEAVNAKFWDDTLGMYCDVYADYNTINKNLCDIFNIDTNSNTANIRMGTLSQEEIQHLQNLLHTAKENPQQKQGWPINHNWVMCTPMEAGIAPTEKAERALQVMTRPAYIGPFGAYLDRTGNPQTMTISTGAFAVAQARYGYADRALDLIERMFATFSMATPGSMSEMSPDYGCFVQAWTSYAAAVPVVQYFFGIQPDAAAGRIVLDPCMPTAWPKATIKKVAVLDGEINLSYNRKAGQITGTNTSGFPIYFPKKDLLITHQSFTINL